jgi:hypothetical protein
MCMSKSVSFGLNDVLIIENDEAYLNERKSLWFAIQRNTSNSENEYYFEQELEKLSLKYKSNAVKLANNTSKVIQLEHELDQIHKYGHYDLLIKVRNLKSMIYVIVVFFASLLLMFHCY